MDTDTQIQNYVQQAVLSESTQALGSYWANQYRSVFGTKINYNSKQQVAYIDLLNNLTKDKKDIDHEILQHTTEVAVRFLDSITTDNLNRNIRLSVSNFDEFLKITETEESIGITYIADLIANFAYRASENLAQEKGPFKNINLTPRHIRPVDFEMWVDSGENFKSGLELSKAYDDQSITSTTWNLVPRRNLNILDFSKNSPKWSSWVDSYESEPLQAPNNTPLNFISTDLNSDDSLNFSEPDTLEKFEIINESEPQLISADNEVQMNHEITPQKDKPIPEVPKTPELNHEIKRFNLGELVQVSDTLSGLYGKIFQIIQIQDKTVRLLGPNLSQDGVLMDSNKVDRVNLFDLLDQLNLKTRSIQSKTLDAGIDYTISMSAGLIFNSENKLLLIQKKDFISNSAWTLPSNFIGINQIPEESILKHIQVKFGLNGRIIDEVGSVMLTRNLTEPESLNSINNVFLINLLSDSNIEKNSKNTDYFNIQFFDLQNLPLLDQLSKIALEKYNRRQKVLNDLAPVPADHSLIVTEKIPNKNESLQIFLNKLHKSSMGQNNTNIQAGKYSVFLEQIIPTAHSFGQLKVNYKYNANGLESFTVDESGLDSKTQEIVGIIVYLINYIISKEGTVKTVLPSLLEKTKISDQTINTFLEVLIIALNDVPTSIKDIDFGKSA